MKKLALPVIAMLLLLAGCMTMPKYTYAPFSKYAIEAGEEKTAGIGDTFFALEEGQMVTEPTYLASGAIASGLKYDLTIVELNQEKIGFQYNEFTYQPGVKHVDYMPILAAGGWLVKQGFNKRFDYAVADKVIRFQGYEFEILGVEKGQLRYRRIK